MIWINIVGLLVVCLPMKIQGQCPVRNNTAAMAIGRDCRKSCTPGDNRCKRGRVCMCAHECGYSCINPANHCSTPSTINNQLRFKVFRKHANGSFIPGAAPPYLFDDIVEYVCEPGYSRQSPLIRHYCHGRRNWTQLGSTICARTCQRYSFSGVVENEMNCGGHCVTDQDCVGRFRCLCDGPCGRSCANPDVNCGPPPSSRNVQINVIGQGFYRVAHYTCDEGYYVHSGNTARECTGGGTWDGSLISCQRIRCGDPAPTIVLMGGQVLNGTKDVYYVGDQVKLGCSPHYRLFGDSVRKCMSNGRWSGKDTVCDVIDQLTRCPHPGVPINGAILTGGNFGVRRTVEYVCNSGYTMIGEKVQECLYFLQWSGGGVPQCINPRYVDTALDSVEKLKLTIARLQNKVLPLNLGNSVGGFHSDTAAEIYFVVDVSDDVRPEALNSSIQFAEDQTIKIARGGLINCFILVYASEASVEVELKTKPVSYIIRSLRNIVADRQNFIKTLGLRRNTYKALEKLNATLENAFLENEFRERLLFFFVHGKHFEGLSPLPAMQSIKATYQDDLEEVYVICFGDNLYDNEVNIELRQLGSTFGRFWPNPDISQLEKFNDTKRQDHSKCGKAGDIGNVKRQAQIGNVIGGFRAAEGSWPWQVTIAERRPSIYNTYKGIMGGGSVLNNQWVLTAAHIFVGIYKEENWTRNVLLSFGLRQRPVKATERLPSYIQVFDSAEILQHSNFSTNTFDYDIALIKIGRQLKQGEHYWEPTTTQGWVNYTFHVRPVCLPCIEGNCANQYLQNFGLFDETQTEKQRCLAEGNWLIQRDARKDKNILAVITGFGHTETLSPFSNNAFTSDYLRQGLIRLKTETNCQMARNVMIEDGLPESIAFTNRMMCGIGGSVTNVVDACKGDSGGALVREIRDEKTGKGCWVQIGLASWGWGCGQTYESNGRQVTYPAYYTNILSLLPWIKQRIVPSKWSKWSAASSCSASCGNGTQLELRECVNGPGCIGATSRSVDCNTQKCIGSLSCTFDNRTFCDWNHDEGDFQWILNIGKTPSSNTGPLYDHTTQSGWYIYIEASSPRRLNHKALLRSPPISNSIPICLRFWYHMHGSATGRLEVLSARVGKYNFSVKWFAEGQQSENETDWRFAEVSLFELYDYEIIIRGIRGKNWASDIAVDDITITASQCDSPSPQTVAPAISSTQNLAGAWSNWRATSNCNSTCGGGRRIEARTCLNGVVCRGGGHRFVNCNIHKCPEWSEWSATSSCSASCGNGTQLELRECVNGPGCIGATSRSVDCNTQTCIGKYAINK